MPGPWLRRPSLSRVRGVRARQAICFGDVSLSGNDQKIALWSESERSQDFVRKSGFGDVVDLIASLQRLIATLQGRTAMFNTFSDAQFDEAAFEAQLTSRM